MTTQVERNAQVRGIWRILRVLAVHCALHAVDREILSRSRPRVKSPLGGAHVGSSRLTTH